MKRILAVAGSRVVANVCVIDYSVSVSSCVKRLSSCFNGILFNFRKSSTLKNSYILSSLKSILSSYTVHPPSYIFISFSRFSRISHVLRL
jgi:hypothetical protein